MQVLDEQRVLSASDLSDLLACLHVTTLDLAMRVRVVSENATTLKFDQSGFEKE